MSFMPASKRRNAFTSSPYMDDRVMPGHLHCLKGPAQARDRQRDQAWIDRMVAKPTELDAVLVALVLEPFHGLLRCPHLNTCKEHDPFYASGARSGLQQAKKLEHLRPEYGLRVLREVYELQGRLQHRRVCRDETGQDGRLPPSGIRSVDFIRIPRGGLRRWLPMCPL